MSEPTHPGDPVPDRQAEFLGMIWFLTPLALTTALLRFGVRQHNHQFGWDDGMMILTMISFLGWSVTLTLYSVWGGTQHAGDLMTTGPDNVARVQLLNWLSQPFGIMGAAFGKVSVSALLLNIIGPAGLNWQRYYIWIVTIWLSMLVGISCSTLTFAQCSPAERLWDERVKGKCLPPEVMAHFGSFAGIWNTFADASLALLPISIFWKLHCSRLKKFQLSIVFGLNIFTSVCSGVKSKYLTGLANRSDFTWATYPIFVCATIELFFMVVCGTLPTLFPLFNWLSRKLGMHTSKIFITSSRSCKSGSRYAAHSQSHELQSGTHGFTTTVEHFPRDLATESADNLVDRGVGEPPSKGVRVDVEYNIETSRRKAIDESGSNVDAAIFESGYMFRG